MKSVSSKLWYGLTAVVRNANVAEDDTMTSRTSILLLHQLQIWASWTLSGLLSGALHAANASETFCVSVTDATKTATCSHWLCESRKNEHLSPICCSCWSMSHQWWWRPRCQECQATDMIGEQASLTSEKELNFDPPFFLFFIALLHISILFFFQLLLSPKR